MKDDARKTRHNIQILITETIDLALPNEGGALVAVEHSRVIVDAETKEEVPEKLKPEDLLDILVNLAVGTLLNSKYSHIHKFQAALAIGKSIISSVSKGLVPLNELLEGVVDDLTDEQKASLELSMSAPSFKAPNS